MRCWRGRHVPLIEVIVGLLLSLHASGKPFSSDKLAVFTACECWIAVRHHMLEPYLQNDVDARLQTAAAAFTTIGLTRVATILNTRRQTLSGIIPARRTKLIVGIERALITDADASVDEAIARFARDHAVIRFPKKIAQRRMGHRYIRALNTFLSNRPLSCRRRIGRFV